AQLELMRALFGGGHPVTAVGDPCQSIYGWRGASAGNMRRFADLFPPVVDGPVVDGPVVDGTVVDDPVDQGTDVHEKARAEVRLLSTSFRNTGRVLDVAAAIQRDLREIAPEVPRLIAPPDRAARGAVVCALLDTSADEAQWVAGQVAGLLRMPAGMAPDGRPWPDGRTDTVRPSDIAVLCRKRTQFATLRTALEAEGIPVEVVGLGGLLTVPEVSDIVATLRVLHSPAASDSLIRTLTSPRWRIGPQDLVALGIRARVLARDQTGPAAADDHLTRAVADFTAEACSLVEALDDLGSPGAYSEEGYPRLLALAANLRALRRHVGRPLPELVTEVERALGLDVEVAARAGSSQVAARADLDAFADAAAAFAGDAQEPTLGAFLAYLTAAETEEFGLEAGQISDTDAVKLATVHSAKGLQWPAVVVPGLAAGTRAQNFPARPRLTTRWTENPRLLPFWLRGDETDLPALGGLDPDSLAAFSLDCADRNMAEERRLAYVAVTRAAYWLACTGYWWGAGKSPLGPSPFLQDVAAGCEAGAGEIAQWADVPEEGAENPALAEPLTASWPQPPGGARYESIREAGDLVLAAAAGNSGDAPADAKTEQAEQIPARYAELVEGWAADADLLLAERSRRRQDGPIPVNLPRRFGVSALVTMARDPAQLAAQIRRPMPRPPAPRAERGTAFHRWLEERFGQMRLIDVDDLAGAVDADLVADDADLADLKARFETGEWGQRWPAEVEMPFETRVGDRLVRGRIDAIFADDPAGGFDVVDWKTGRPPRPGRQERAVAVQLAAYRLAWAALARVPVAQVRAAFYYVRENLTVRPADLLDTDGLAALIENVPAEASAVRSG
ncbi:MAG: ATP-dependent DNA helicase, partial [Streptosporangiaceae bacterium]